jgi:hypothetical protein
MATNPASQHMLLDELDARQNEVLAELDLLNQRVIGLLDQFTRPSANSAPPQPSGSSSEGGSAPPQPVDASSRERAA